MEIKLLEECCEILDSMRVPITATNRQKGIYPYYGANGIQDYVDDFLFDDELVLLAEDGGNFGSVDRPIAYRVSGKCWVNNHAHVLKPKLGINVDYLCYSLMYYNVDGLINGATRKKLTQSAMRKMKILVRSLGEQEHIVRRLSSIMQIKKLRENQMKLLDELIKSRFVEMFGDPVANDKNWPIEELDSICSAIVDCPHSTPSYTAENTGYMCIRSSIVKENHILWDEIEYIPEHEYRQRILRKKPEKGDIIYTREGAILGIAAMIDRNCNVALGQRSMLLSPNNSICLPQFLSVAMNFDSFLRKALGGISGSASPHINVGDIKAFAIILPPIALQEQFASFVEQTDKSKLTIQKSLDELETLNKALMQKYFGGNGG